MTISKIGVNAPLVLKTVAADSTNTVMPAPESPDEIAYYDFSQIAGLGGAPGRGGNTVLAGHVDSGTKACDQGRKKPPCEAVLWDLRKLVLGDQIDLTFHGVKYSYRVTGSQLFGSDDAQLWLRIVSTTPTETLTIITCEGEFINNEYVGRRVVTAARI